MFTMFWLHLSVYTLMQCPQKPVDGLVLQVEQPYDAGWKVIPGSSRGAVSALNHCTISASHSAHFLTSNYKHYYKITYKNISVHLPEIQKKIELKSGIKTYMQKVNTFLAIFQ